MKKLITFGLSAATVLSMTGGALMPVAGALTVAELQAQIAALTAQIAALGGSSSAACYAFTMDLTEGSTGADVTALQNYLAGTGHFSVAATGYFGPITKAAVAAWQTANGVAPAYGYFGPVSRAKYASLCSAAPAEEEEEEADGGFLSGDDEGSLVEFDNISNISGEEVGEGEEDVEILGLQFEADGADQMIQRVNVVFDTPTEAAEDDLEDFITEVSVWLDGEELGRMDVDEASYDRGDDEYTFRFTGLEGVVEDGEEGELTVAVSGANSVNGDIEGEGWSVHILENGIRAASPNGTSETYDDADWDETFTLETFASSNNVELVAKRADESPEEQVIEGEADDEFEAEFLVFELKAKNSDITVYGLEFDIASAPATVDTDHMAQELILTCGDDDWSENVPDAGAQVDDIVFADLELEIAEGDTLVCTVSATMNEIDGVTFEEGASFTVDLDVSETDAEDETGEGLDGADLTGSAAGYEQTFNSEGYSVELNDDTDSSVSGGVGTYTFVLDITAFGDADVDLEEADFNYTVDGPGGHTAGVDQSLDAESSVEEAAGVFTLNDETGEFTFKVFIQPLDAGDTGTYKVTLDDVDGVVVDESLTEYIAYVAP